MRLRSMLWLAPALFAAALCLAALDKPIFGDEIVWVTSGHTITAHIADTSAAHPPLYLYLLNLSYRIFGEGPAGARLIGIASMLISFALMRSLAGHLFSDRRDRDIVVLLAAILYGANPLMLQGALLLDIDSAVLPPVMLMLLLAFFKTAHWAPTRRTVTLGILFGLSLWAKLITPPLFVVATFAFHALDRRVRRSIVEPAAILAIGAALFLATFLLYVALSGYPADQFNETAVKLQEIFNSIPAFVTRTLVTLGQVSLWLTPGFAALFLASLIWRIRRYWRERRLENVDLLAICAALIFVLYVVIRSTAMGGFPKYHIPMLPAASLLTAAFVYRLRPVGRPVPGWIVPALAAFMLVYYVSVVGDPLYVHFAGAGHGTTVWGEPLATLPLSSILDRIVGPPAALPVEANPKAQILSDAYLQIWATLVPLVLLMLVLRRSWPQRPWAATAAAGLLVVAIAGGAATALVQAGADYATAYYYGRRGTLETIDYVQARTQPGDTLIAGPEVEYYTGRRTEFITATDSLESVVLKVRRGEAEMAVLAAPESEAIFQEMEQRAIRNSLDDLDMTILGSYVILTRPDSQGQTR